MRTQSTYPSTGNINSNYMMRTSFSGVKIDLESRVTTK
jgi:hypothetical protein